MDSHWGLDAPEQWLSLLGSLVILLAYFLTVARPEKKVLSFYLSMLGGVALLVMALLYHNIGLIFLEVSWISINAWGIWQHRQSHHKG